MKKNSEYVGVDEKFVPENEKYVKDSILGNREESKNKIKKGLKIGLGVYIIYVLLAIAFGVIMVMLILNHSKNMNKQIFDLYGGAVNQMFDKTQFQVDSTNEINEMHDSMNSMMESFNAQVNNVNDNYNKTSLNSNLEIYSGTQYGSNVRNLLDKIVTSNKTNNDHIITVIYKEINTTLEDKIIDIKHSLDKLTEYEVSLDYDANGYINKVTIKDI